MEPLNVAIENQGNLKRKITVTVPLEKVQEAYDRCYKSLKDKVNINGFRKGKVPRSLIEKRFKAVMRQEAIESLVPEYFKQALDQENLTPAGRPQFNDLDFDRGKPLVFSASFEVYPTIQPPDYRQFESNTASVEVTPEEVAEHKRLHLDYAATFTPKDGPAGDGDRIDLDVQGWLEAESVADFKDHAVIIGAEQFFPGFDDRLKGLSASEEKSFDLTLPNDYNDEQLRGKTLKFTVKVKTVKQKQPAELDDAFFKRYGPQVKSEAEFDQFLENEVRFRKEQAINKENRQALREKLYEILDFDVPEQLLAEETQARIHQARQKKEGAATPVEELEKRAGEEAIRQLRLAILVRHLLDSEEIRVDQQAVNRRFEMTCAMIGVKPEELIKEEYGRQIYQETHSIMTEETVLDFIIEKAQAS